MAHRRSPNLRTEEGVSVGALTTVAECDRHEEQVAFVIAGLERKLAYPKETAPDPHWRTRARTTLRTQRRVLIAIQHLRAALARQERESRRTVAALAGARRVSAQTGKACACPHCGKRFIDQRSVRQHVAAAHPVPADAMRKAAGVEVFR